ncbi:MAG: NPCBM/NEW2 domain-containing protein, partial [Peptostreptococcaceae bacterium]
MKNNKLVIAVTTSIITATSLVPLSTFADEVVKKNIPAIEQNIVDDQENKYPVKKLPAIGSEELKEYDKDFKVPISNIETNGKHWSNATIGKAIDGDINTNWHAGIQNSDTHTNEIIMTLDKTTVVDRLSYYSPHTTGFAHEFEVYVSQEATGDNFTKVAEGEMSSKNDDNNEIRFKPVKSKRVKLVYKRGGGNWAVAYELGVYKEDTLYNEVLDLFKDKEKMILADKYVGNIQAIEELNEKAKGHVLYSNIEVFIDDAMAVVKHKPVKPVKAITGLFEYKDNKEYLEQFKVTQNNIKGISNNAGHYVGQVIENAADGKLDTYFETNKSNSDNWKNEITLELNDREVIDSIVIGTRADGKGAAENVEILVSNTSQGDNFELVSTAKLSETNELSEIKFNPVESKRIKLRYVNSSEDWVTLNEFWVFKEDKIRKEVEGIFVDGTMMELKDEYNSIEAIEALESKISNHLLKPMLDGILEDARKILDNGVINDIYVAKQEGDMADHAKNILKMYRNGQNYQVTGYAAQPGDTLQIYVDIDEKDYDKTPSLMMSQNLGTWSGWGKAVPLKPGKNIIVVPDLPGHNEGEKKGGALYIINPYTPEEQSSAPKIRIVGANKFPVYREGDNAEEFRQELIEYKKKLDEDNTSGAGKVIDIMEFESKRVMISGTTTAAYNVFVRDGNDPANTVKKWNADMEEIYRFHGLDGSSLKSDPKNLKEHVRVMDPYGSMYAVSDHVGIQPQHVEGALSAHDKGWGMYHEIGHRMEVAGREHAEVTNNMTSMAMTAFNDGRPNDRMFFEEMYVDATREDLRDYNDRGGRSNLGMYWQLELYQDGIWAEIEKEYRGAPRNTRLTGDARDNFIRTTCKILNEDVTEFFEKSGFKASDALDKEMSEMYQNSGKKLWYLNNDSYRYKGEGLPSNTEVSVEVKDTQGKLSLRSNVPKADLLGYEIMKDGKVIGFTSKNTFQDPNYDASRQAVYTVKAYGHKLDSSKESAGVNSHKPLLNISQSEIYIALNDKFQPLDYIQALDYTGTDISKDVVIETDLDNKVRGTYDVKYTVVANGQTNTKTIKANVVSDIQEVSELDWKRGSSGWLSIHKDKAINSTDSKIKLNVNGNILDFNKGLSVASHSEIVYDIAEKGYTRFVSRVGAEMFNATDSTSVKAKVYLDGVEAFASDLLTVNTESVLVDLNLEGVKEVKLVIEDGGNGGRDDVASWGNPLFINSNSKPTL